MLNSLQRLCAYLAIFLLPLAVHAQCNGHLELCNRSYDQVAFLTTHNAFNAGEDGFSLPNQNFGLTKQLQDGVRALMLDVYDEGGVATVYHGFSFLGTATLASNLIQIKDFMDANPNEVLTIIFECYINSAMMNDVFAEVGLLPYLHEQILGESWPTLQEMTYSGRRLVVLSDKNDALPQQGWYHYVWDFAVETSFSNNSPSSFSCEFNRGDETNDLFIVNHFVTDATFGVGQPDQAAIVNELSFFYDRVHGCQLEKQKFPNFPTIDFYELGQTLAVIDSLNGVQTSVGVELLKRNLEVQVFPNPSAGLFRFALEADLIDGHFTVINLHGATLQQGEIKKQTVIDLRNQPNGLYLLSVFTPKESKVIKLVNLSGQ